MPLALCVQAQLQGLVHARLSGALWGFIREMMKTVLSWLLALQPRQIQARAPGERTGHVVEK